ncbi:CHAT domain-containing protein [Nostoc parmelioides FACHB-3921]|uniref:CHAT domain-containing protein n=2 Tax=Nostoc TaxID=1177 RepID=A0ABR8BDT1_9NOSO|nr:CHAT domain-containing protein [Nostoc parmelioides FACHB-3921]
MNEQRQQAYLNLIRSLLDSPSGEEAEILAVNQELLDAGFVQTVEEVAQMFSQQGDENTANWLQGLATQLREALNLNTKVDLQSFSDEKIQTYYQFLMQVLQATADGKGDSQVVYPLLAKNTDKLDGVLAEILRRWVTKALGKVEAHEVEKLAVIIIDFSNLIQQFPLGDKASNLEIAITGYEIVLTVRTREALPLEWAATQNNLAAAYVDRIQGDKAENIENAIAAHTAALTVYTREALPLDWAMTQYNLANAYRERIEGDKADNIENAVAASTAALSVYTREALPGDWAETQNNLGLGYKDRIKGDKADNIENAIAAFNAALSFQTREALPADWAGTQNNLGLAYRDRIKGDRADNIENAIAAFNAALSFQTREALPRDWAMTQNNLASAYYSRIKGDRADNIENAIVAINAALSVYTREALPISWAMTQNHLGLAYRHRIKGDKADNIEKAIAAFTAALSVYTREALPQDWAGTQNNLAAAYLDRIKGDKADNIENAIVAINAALSVYTREALPISWAATQNNLGLAYRNRIKGDKADNIEKAIAAFTAALTFRNKEALPQDWAGTQNNLAAAYLDRIKGDKADNIENAIAAYTAALTVYTREALPISWAATQNNLAAAYRERIKGDKADNIENAIAAYTAALTVRTREALPQDWAMTQNNLAIAYYLRIKGDKADNIKNAIAAYTAALTVRTREALPQNHAETLFGLGRTYQDVNWFDLAYNAFKSAIDTVESLRSEIVSGEESKRKQAEQFNKVYSRIVEVCLKLSNITAAIEYVERSKTRSLVEQILERDSTTIFPPEVVTQLETYRDEIATGQYQIQNSKAENPQVLAQHLQQLRQQRNELQNRYLPVGYGFKFDSFQPTLDDRTAIIEWYILNDKILAFIVTKQGEVTVWQSQPEDREALVNWRIQYLRNYYSQKDKWLNNLGQSLKELASILHIDEILTRIPQHCDQLILIPHTFLHLFPLHALPVNQSSENSSCLLDLFPSGVSYAPSCQLLQQVQQRQRPDFQSLFAIQNPTGDLNYTDLEVQVIQSYFNPANVLKKTDATLTAINNCDLNTYHCAHFSCHGYFNLTNAGKSALILANAPTADTSTKPDSERYLNVRAGETHDLEKCLTLDKIFALQLEKCRLVTLSACETGLIDFDNTSDEYIGLPSGFLLAGSKAVVSSLWTVSDLSTAFLMMKFYENLQTINNVSLALNQAQEWLRNLTTEEFAALLVKYHPQIEEIFAQLPKEKQPVARAILKRTSKRKPHPFAAPFYWAGFTATGL